MFNPLEVTHDLRSRFDRQDTRKSVTQFNRQSAVSATDFEKTRAASKKRLEEPELQRHERGLGSGIVFLSNRRMVRDAAQELVVDTAVHPASVLGFHQSPRELPLDVELLAELFHVAGLLRRNGMRHRRRMLH
jgi:hypothetical protein